MATQQTQQKETKTEKCTCVNALAQLKKEVDELKVEIAVLRAVLRGGRQIGRGTINRAKYGRLDR